MELVHVAQPSYLALSTLAKFLLERRYAVAYVLGSFRDSPAPRGTALGVWSGALRITRPTRWTRNSASLPCGLTEVLALVLAARSASAPYQNFGPVVGLCGTHRCQRSVASPSRGKTPTIIPHSLSQNKADFQSCAAVPHRNLTGTSLAGKVALLRDRHSAP